MSITIRAPTQADQSTIVSIIREAKINPRNLHWEHFRIAEEDGKIVGIRQVKVHKEGTQGGCIGVCAAGISTAGNQCRVDE